MRSKLTWLTGIVAGLVLVAAGLVATNPAPRVPAWAAHDPATSAQPYVVKLHATWCPICIATKGAWAEMQRAYAGNVRFVVFDFTDRESTEATRRRASALGLDAVFAEYEGETGTVLVLDGASKEVRQSLHGLRSAADYGAAIDRARTTALPQPR